MWALRMLLAVASATNSTSKRRIYGMIPLVPSSSFLDEQRERFVAEFDPVFVYGGAPATEPRAEPTARVGEL